MIRSLTIPLLLVCLMPVSRVLASDTAIQFRRDVLPLLSDRCFHCHGPDESHREAGLRLDLREHALAERDGGRAIVPGQPEKSELLLRIASGDDTLVMPPVDSHRKPLSPREIALVRQWIAEGAEWGRHWSFEKPVRPAVPDLARHPIDAFIRARLREAKLSPAPPAEPHVQLRRVTFDLTGLPPTREELDAFLANPTSDAYAAVVDRLLGSPHYGERMAMWWLDAARYSDTDGYQQDATRANWPWRDWVIQSFNDNKPYDQFTLEQFAGDLLPEATPEQILATCFHRNHMTNGEGGRDPEESRIDYVIDRVNTTGTVWLGLTLGCCQCHSHKFDPVTQLDYYSLFAFFNSIDEDGRAGGGAKPYLKYQSPRTAEVLADAQQLVETRGRIEADFRARAERAFEPWLQARVEEVKRDFTAWHPVQARRLESVAGTLLLQETDHAIQTSGPLPRQDDYRITFRPELDRITGIRLEVLPHPTHTEGKLSRGASGEFILTNVKLQVRKQGKSQLRDLDLAGAVADHEPDVKGRNYGKVQDTLDDDPRNGWTTADHQPHAPHVALFALAEPLILSEDEELILVLYHRSTVGDANIGRFRLSVTDQPGNAVKSLDPMPLERLAEHLRGPHRGEPLDPDLRSRILEQFLADHDDYQQAKAEFDRANQQLTAFRKAAGELNVMVLQEREVPRTTHILKRGVWDQKGDAVSPGFPEAILPQSAELSRTRLDLAKWLVSPENPLSARVVVNQLWQLCFGSGLVRTPDDFGLQGDFPTHPELLDWMALELIDHNWDLQHVLRLIVTSETYRQSSTATAAQLERDPENRLWGRGARFRLPSWMIRDAALRSSGLLEPTLGGPPVYPYQPEGVWEEMFMGRFRYEPSQGTAQFRRTVYAFWRRSAAPTFLFDSAQRRVCEVGMHRTNTPLHALTLINDLTMLEASRHLGHRVLTQKAEPSERIAWLFQQITSRLPTPAEGQILETRLQQSLTYYNQYPDQARLLLSFGQPEQKLAEPRSELAAYFLLASMIFNLDEAITHE